MDFFTWHVLVLARPPISGRCERVEAHKWSTDASVLGGGKEKPAGPDLENQEITLRYSKAGRSMPEAY